MTKIPFDDWYQADQLMTRYAHTIETGDRVGLGDCLADNVHLDLSELLPDRPPAEGRAGAVDMITDRWRSGPSIGQVRRHLFSNFLIHEYSPHSIASQVSLKFIVTPVEGSPYIFFTGQYDDTLHKDSEGRWRISSRRLRIDRAEEGAS